MADASGNDGAGTGTGGGATPERRSCGVMDVHRRLLVSSTGYAAARAEVEDAVLNWTGEEPPGVAQVPVVVHVVWNTPDQDIPDEQVHSQIDVLNDDFRAANPDIDAVPDPFRDLVADAQVEFHLATVDPAGEPTSGITRTRTDTDAFSTDDEVKAAATGGADAWPADRYLNIWVCPLGGGLLGYAQFPGGPAATDGIVVTHTGFGTTGTAAAPFDRGRTTTHEVGHYLDLFHIWGDDGDGCSGSDLVDDTPNQAGPNAGAPEFPVVTCDNGPHGDLFMDYMDYVDDAAMTMFTHGQVARMRACIAGVRSSLVDWRPAPLPSS